MSKTSNKRNIIQIGVGAACLAGAWYYGQISSAGQSPDLVAERPPLQAEDLVWDNQSRSAPPVAPATAANLAEHMSGSVPQLANDRTQPRNGSTSIEIAENPGPMIVEPDFSELEKRFGQNRSGSPSSGVATDRIATGGSEGMKQLPAISPNLELSGIPLPQPGLVDAGQPWPELSSNTGNGEVSVLAKPVVPSTANPGPAGLVAVSSRTSSAIATGANGFRMHVVRPGESLQSLSREYFGSPDYYLDIYVANQDVLSSPAAVRNGMSLRIPNGNQE